MASSSRNSFSNEKHSNDLIGGITFTIHINKSRDKLYGESL